MIDEERMADLLLQWEERFDQGEDVPAASLCQEWPELTEPLAQCIADLKRMAWLDRKVQQTETTKTARGKQSHIVTTRNAGSVLKSGMEPIPGYVLIEKLGQGGFGEVWSASIKEPRTSEKMFFYGDGDRPVAMKFFHELPTGNHSAHRYPFQIELNGLVKIRQAHHPWVLRVFDLIPYKGSIVLITELADLSLETIFKTLRNDVPVPIRCAYGLFRLRDIAEALDYLQDQHDLMHLDIKPSNILVKDNAIRLGDFGTVVKLRPHRSSCSDVAVSSIIDTKEPSNRPNTERSWLGVSQEALSPRATLFTAAGAFTRDYAPPEAFHQTISRSFDQYSLALTFCELVTGSNPFHRTGEAQLADKEAGVMDLTLLPEALRPITAKALSPSPQNRFTSCVEFINTMQTALWPTIPIENDLTPLPQITVPTHPADHRKPGSPHFISLPLLAEMRAFQTAYSYNFPRLPDREHLNHGFDRFWSYGIDSNDVDQTISSISQVLSLIPNDGWAFCRRGMAYERSGNDDLAISDFTQAIELVNDNNWCRFQAYRYRGAVHQRNGRTFLAINDYRDAFQIDPRGPDPLSQFFSFYSKRATAHLGMMDYNNAIGLREWIAGVDPKNISASTLCGDAYRQIGDYERSAVYFQRALRLESSKQHMIRLQKEGALTIIYRDIHDINRAIADYSRAISLYPKSPIAYFARAEAYRARNDFALAIADLAVGIELAPDYFVFKEDERDFRPWWSESTMLDNITLDSFLDRNRFYTATGEFRLALADACKFIRLHAKSAYGYTTRATLYRNLGNLNLALADANEAIRLDPDSSDGYYIRATVHRAKEEFDQADADEYESIMLYCANALRDAEKWLTEGDFHNPIWRLGSLSAKYASVYRLWAETHRRKNEFDLAIADYTESIRIDPYCGYAFGMRAWLSCFKGEVERAISDASEAIRLGFKEAWTYHARAVAYFFRNQFDSAIIDASNAIRLDPKYAAAFGVRAAAHHSKNEFGRAIADASEAIRLDRNHVASFVVRAKAYWSKNEFDRAIVDASEAIRLDPKNADAFTVRARANCGKNQIDRVIADASEVIRLNPDHIDAYALLGWGYLSKGDFDRAIEAFTAVIRKRPSDAYAYGMRARTFGQKNNYEHAISDATEAIRLDPKHTFAYLARGVAFRRKGEFIKAVGDLTKHLRLGPVSESATTELDLARKGQA